MILTDFLHPTFSEFAKPHKNRHTHLEAEPDGLWKTTILKRLLQRRTRRKERKRQATRTFCVIHEEIRGNETAHRYDRSVERAWCSCWKNSSEFATCANRSHFFVVLPLLCVGRNTLLERLGATVDVVAIACTWNAMYGICNGKTLHVQRPQMCSAQYFSLLAREAQKSEKNFPCKRTPLLRHGA